MKTTRYTLLATALLLAASCANDPVEDIVNPSAPGAALPGGTFVIDYTAGMEGADTRSDASERIQSLDYLIYQKSTTEDGDYTLLKKRSIPDIGPDTPWPLTRNNMTWEQREALKDTLSTSHYYKMVFVANADDEIWNEKDTPEESMFHALQNVVEGSNFNDGRLVLPPRVFTENDMYYMWTGAVTPSEADENHTVKKEVLLQRMINKVEVKLDASLVTTGNVETDITTYLNGFIDQEMEEGGILHTNLTTLMTKFGEKCKSSTYPGALSNFRNYIKSSSFVSSVLSDIEEDLKSDFRNHMIDNYSVIKRLEWDKVHYVNITYAAEGRAYAINFNKESIAAEDNADPLSYPMENESFIYYTFGRNDITDDLNKIATFTFKDESNTLFTLAGEGMPQNNKVGGNLSLTIACNPLKEIDNTLQNTYNYSQQYNLDNKIGDAWNNEIKTDWTTVSILKSEINHSLEDDGESLNGMKITFDYPCNPVIEWKQTEPTNNQ